MSSGDVLPFGARPFQPQKNRRTHAPSHFPPQVRFGSWMERRFAANMQPQVDIALGALLGLHIHGRIHDLQVSEVTMRAFRITPDALLLGAKDAVQQDQDGNARLKVSPCGETIKDGGRLNPLSPLEEQIVERVGSISDLHTLQLDIGRELLKGYSEIPYIEEPIILPKASDREAAERSLPQVVLAAAAVL